jgi:hypothetical protein
VIVVNASIEVGRQKRDIAASLEEAQMRAYDMIELATKEAGSVKERIVSASRFDKG